MHHKRLVATPAGAPTSTFRLWTLDYPANPDNEDPELDGSSIPTWWRDREADVWQSIDTQTAQLGDGGIRLDNLEVGTTNTYSFIDFSSNTASFPNTYSMAIAYKPVATPGVSMNIMSDLFNYDGMHEEGSSSTDIRSGAGTQDHIVVGGHLYQTGVDTRGQLYTAIQSNNVMVVRDSTLGNDITLGYRTTAATAALIIDIYGIIVYSDTADEADAVAFMQAQIP